MGQTDDQKGADSQTNNACGTTTKIAFEQVIEGFDKASFASTGAQAQYKATMASQFDVSEDAITLIVSDAGGRRLAVGGIKVKVEVMTATSSKADFVKRTVEQGTFAAQVLEELKTKMQDNNLAVPAALKLGSGGNTALETITASPTPAPTPATATTTPPAAEQTYKEKAKAAFEKVKAAAANVPLAPIAAAAAVVVVAAALFVYRRRRQRQRLKRMGGTPGHGAADPIKSGAVAGELAKIQRECDV